MSRAAAHSATGRFELEIVERQAFAIDLHSHVPPALATGCMRR